MTDADRPDPIFSQCHEGSFIDTASSASSELRVVIPAFDDGDRAFGPVVWRPSIDDSGDVLYPSNGDWALLTESDLGSWVVLAWRPS